MNHQSRIYVPELVPLKKKKEENTEGAGTPEHVMTGH
jgi:hypothetical protein